MKTVFLLVLFFFFCTSCVNDSWFAKQIGTADILMDHNPDSAFSILSSLKLPSNLSEEDNALYCLLLVKAMDKTYKDLSSDSIINIAFDYFKDTNDSSLIAQSYFYKGRVLQEMQNEKLAIEHFLKSIDFCTTTDSRLLFLSHYYLGNLYSDQELFEEELAMQREAYNCATFLNDSLYISHSLCAIGSALNHLEFNNEALEAYKQASAWIAPNDSLMKSYIYNSLGSIYNKIGEYRLALNYAQLSEFFQCDIEELPYVYILKGHVYANMEKSDSAKYYYERSLNTLDLYTKAASYRGLYCIEKKQKNYVKAMSNNECYLFYRDSIDNKRRTDMIIKMQSIYLFDKLRDENNQLQLAKTQSENYYYKLCAIFILFFVILLTLYFLFKIEKERKIRQQEIMLAENDKQLHICEVKQMEKEKEIMEYKQKELLLRGNFLSKMVSVFVPKLVNYSCNERIKLSEEDWDYVIDTVDIAFNEFSKRLCSYYPKLTLEDIRLCALLKMNMSVSELASIYCVEKISIYKRKERIKKMKMMIFDSTLSLDDIIHDF